MQTSVSKATSKLKLEHRSILQLFDQVMRTLQQEAYGPRDSNTLLRLVQEFRTQLEVHITKEEDGFFPLLERLSEDDVIKTFREEHRQILNFAKLLPDRPEGISDLNLLMRLGEKIRGHISKEENILFWLAQVRIEGPQRKRHTQPDYQR